MKKDPSKDSPSQKRKTMQSAMWEFMKEDFENLIRMARDPTQDRGAVSEEEERVVGVWTTLYTGTDRREFAQQMDQCVSLFATYLEASGQQERLGEIFDAMKGCVGDRT